MFEIYQGTTSPSLADTIQVDGVPFDLSGSTVNFCMRLPTSSTLVVNAAATIVNATAGTVRYDWASEDVANEGNYVFYWKVILPNSKEQDTPESELSILTHAETLASDLCTLADVRAAMNLPDSVTTMDETIRMYVSEASAQIIKHSAREFAPFSPGLTRRFRVFDWRVDFHPYDLANLTGAVLHPESMEAVIDITIDIELRPFTNTDGVYTSMRISPWLPPISTVALKFGMPYIDVTGDWGFTSVPDDVKRATVIAVRSWMRRDQQMFAEAGHETPDLQPIPQGTFFIPYASKQLLLPYKRWANAV